MTSGTNHLSCTDYHVAWICPLADVELLPARLMLDEEHSTPPYNTHYDENTYICGAINGHAVVVATCPQGETGNVNAGRLTGSIFKTFPNIRMTVLVGIGGGIPRPAVSDDPLDDIHLGDVVVGWPGDGKPACVYHDRGKLKVNSQVEVVGTMQNPDWRLLQALGILASDHKLRRTKFPDQLARLRDFSEFAYPGIEHDRLYKATYRHVGEYRSKCGACDQNELIQRKLRTEDKKRKLVFHQGRIATGNLVIQDGEQRDQISARCDGALCVEMESAGVDVNRRCLVIRGISDYADSHKNDAWRCHAAGNAAAFTRELLCRIRPDTVNSMEEGCHDGNLRRSNEITGTRSEVTAIVAARPLDSDYQRPPRFPNIDSHQRDVSSAYSRSDPLSVAASAIQVVDSGCKVLSQVRIQDVSLSKVADDLKRAYNTLQSLLGPFQEFNDKSTESIGAECQNLAAELLEALKKLDEVADQNKEGTFRQALVTVWPMEHIELLEGRLSGARQHLTLPLLGSLKEQLQQSYHDNATFEVEVGRSFLNHLRDFEKIQGKLLKDIEQRLLDVIQLEAMHTRPPPQIFDLQAKRFLKTLRFTEITARQDRIPIAVQKTFEWVYRPPKADESWSSFVDWLHSHKSIYWITGKPGSGKSTLMKFLQDDTRTAEHLRHWSREAPLVCAGFYFWNSGTQIEMSNEGLTRSLLHQVCSQCEDLLPDIFPDRWEALNLLGSAPRPWTVSELLAGFRIISTSAFAQRRFFFFIDGLDEFEGNKNELIDLVKVMVACKHIKICVASRPWIVFQEAFGAKPNLQLEDLTSPDIEIYVETNFSKSERFSQLRRREPNSSRELFREIVTRSSGVFLWVHLVVMSLLEGVSNGDKFADLRERLAELPQDLEDLFRKILSSIEPRYKAHASQLLRIHHAHGPISVLRLSFADEDDERLTKADTHTPLTMDEFLFRCGEMKNRVNSRTKGLLEVAKWPQIRQVEDGSAEVSPTLRGNWQVQYLHRTVRDFFSEPEAWLALSDSTPGFDPHLALCRAFIFEMKFSYRGASLSDQIQRNLYSAMLLASLADSTSHSALIPLLDSLNNIIKSLLNHDKIHMVPMDAHVPHGHSMLFPVVLELDLDFYVEHLLDGGHPAISRKQFVPYVSFTFEKHFPEGWPNDTQVSCLQNLGVDSEIYAVSTKCLKLLVEHGASIFEKYSEMPYLKHLRLEFSEVCFRAGSNHLGEGLNHWLNAMEILIPLGADPSFFWRVIPKAKVREINRFLPELGDRLREMLKVADNGDGTVRSPRLQALEKIKRRRAIRLEPSAAKRIRQR